MLYFDKVYVVSYIHLRPSIARMEITNDGTPIIVNILPIIPWSADAAGVSAAGVAGVLASGVDGVPKYIKH